MIKHLLLNEVLNKRVFVVCFSIFKSKLTENEKDCDETEETPGG